jgi:hypothetical protein
MRSAIVFAAALAAAPAFAQTLVPVRVQDLFVPAGFDANDEAMAVLDGYLPNACYRLAHSTATYDSGERAYRVTQYAWLHGGPICLQIATPFTTEVRLGVVPAGGYRVVTDGASASTLTVTRASNEGPDDHPYAPIDEARVDYDAATGLYTAVLRGRFTTPCMDWDEIQVVDSGRTIELLPIVRVDMSGDCPASTRSFERRTELPRGMTPGRHLLHVRSLSGKAVNVVFTVFAPRTR